MNEPPREPPSPAEPAPTEDPARATEPLAAVTPAPVASPATSPRPSQRGRPLSCLPPALGCFAVLCVTIGGILGVLWSGVASSLIAVASGKPAIRVVKVAAVSPDGRYRDASPPVFPADNRGMAGRVVYDHIPQGYRGDALIIWERLDSMGSASEIRQPDIIPVTDAMAGTTWWYTLRQPFPPGHYQFSVALLGPAGQRQRVGTVRFEVRAESGATPAPTTTTATPAQPGYRPPTRPPAQTPPGQPPATSPPPGATATPPLGPATTPPARP